MAERWILHIDLDAFFANAEVLRRPELRGQPVIVGGDPDGRGVVASATYAARACGVRSAMPLAHARRLCPEAVFLRGDFLYYHDLSHRFRAILHDTSPVVEIASIDEAYLDATGLSEGRGQRAEGRDESWLADTQGGPDSPLRPSALCPLPSALSIKSRLLADTGLTCSIGVAPNKTLAKI